MPGFITTKFTIIGAGAGGLCAGIKLLESGVDDFLVFDSESRVGGTWQRNTLIPVWRATLRPRSTAIPSRPTRNGRAPSHLSQRSATISNGSQIERGVEPHLRLSTTVTSADWRETRRALAA